QYENHTIHGPSASLNELRLKTSRHTCLSLPSNVGAKIVALTSQLHFSEIFSRENDLGIY
ncbi:MAG: hypothetical protein M1445_00405, partial [Bacteroidetes bacterium]|nr:hypothetical protein [Bacteroidota bacterium]